MASKSSTDGGTPNYSFSITFNPEILRIIAYVGLIVTLIAGVFLTENFVTVAPDSTAIYKLFGFNHICNVLDHEPSKTVTAMLFPLWEVPFVFYVIFNFLRVQDAYKENKAPFYTYAVSGRSPYTTQIIQVGAMPPCLHCHASSRRFISWFICGFSQFGDRVRRNFGSRNYS